MTYQTQLLLFNQVNVILNVWIEYRLAKYNFLFVYHLALHVYFGIPNPMKSGTYRYKFYFLHERSCTQTIFDIFDDDARNGENLMMVGL